MNWEQLAPLLAAAMVTIFGWYVVHLLSANRDRQNKRREQRLEHLLNAFRTFVKASGRSELREIESEVQTAIADVQVFGTAVAAKHLETWVVDIVNKGSASLDPLLETLRDELREELKLRRLGGPVSWLRFERPGAQSPAGVPSESLN